MSAECNYNAYRLFNLDDIHNIFVGQRFKIKPVAGVKVGRNRFGIVVDEYNLVPKLLKRPYAVNGGVVKFDTLTDSDRTGAENDDFLFLVVAKLACLAVLVICRIKIRCFSGKFCAAGINHFIYTVFVERKGIAA